MDGNGYSENPTPQRKFEVGEVTVLKDEPLSVDLQMVAPPPTATKVLFPNPTPLRAYEVGEVTVLKDDPLSVDFTMVPEEPTATNAPRDVSTVKEVISIVLLTFPAESLTIIVQSEYVLSLNAIKVMVLFPLVAVVIPDEQEPP